MPHEFAHGAIGKVGIACDNRVDNQYVIVRRHERLDQDLGTLKCTFAIWLSSLSQVSYSVSLAARRQISR